MNLEVKNFSPTAQFPFTLTAALPGGGDFSLKGKCGPINAGNTGATPFEASVTMRKLDLAASGFVRGFDGNPGDRRFRRRDQLQWPTGQNQRNSQGRQSETRREGRALEAKRWQLKYCRGSRPENGCRHADAGRRRNRQGRRAPDRHLPDTGGNHNTQHEDERKRHARWTNSRRRCRPWGSCYRQGPNCKGGSLSADLAIAGPTDKPDHHGADSPVEREARRL